MMMMLLLMLLMLLLRLVRPDVAKSTASGTLASPAVATTLAATATKVSS